MVGALMTMTHKQFREALRKLGLSTSQASSMLGVSETQIRRIKMAPGRENSRPVNGTMERLVKAMLYGYRPPDWPEKLRGHEEPPDPDDD